MDRPRIITLTTDFGLRDGYVAAMKAVVLRLAPAVTIVDVSHEVARQNVGEAGFLLHSVYRYFPRDAIHVAVVDPGVGTQRRAIAIELESGTFIGPDNGLFGMILAEENAVDGDTGRLLRGTAVHLTNALFQLPDVSTTFHGRDIFAPAAAHVALGESLLSLGPRVDYVTGEAHRAQETGSEVVEGVVVHVDHFGNLITDIRGIDLPTDPRVEIAGVPVDGIASNYQERELAALVGSSGFVEVAARNASAADRLHLTIGAPVRVWQQG